MNTSATTFRLHALESFDMNLALAYSASKPETSYEEDQFNFSTIDGSVMSYSAGTTAVSSGAGIFIGGYFVGVSDDFLC